MAAMFPHKSLNLYSIVISWFFISTESNKIPDLLSFFVVLNISINYNKVDETWNMYLNHSPILFTLLNQHNPKKIISKLLYKLTDWYIDIILKLDLENITNLVISLKTKKQLGDKVVILVHISLVIQVWKEKKRN